MLVHAEGEKKKILSMDLFAPGFNENNANLYALHTKTFLPPPTSKSEKKQQQQQYYRTKVPQSCREPKTFFNNNNSQGNLSS